MKMNLRVQALILSALMAASALSACGSDAPDADTTTSVTESPNTDVTPESPYAELEVRDLGGKDVNVLIRSEWAYEFMVEEENGDLINDAIYKRNAAIEERYNCNLNFIDQAGNWSNNANFKNAIHNSVMAGDGAYDFIAGYQACLPYNIVQGDMMNLLLLPHLTLDAPWWSREGLDALTVNDRCFMVGGDIGVSLLEGIFCMFYNKSLAEDHKVEDLYQLVRDKKWTHDKFMSVIKDTSMDMDGDSKMTKSDSFGFIAHDTYIRPYLVTYDTPTLDYDDDGELKVIWNNEHTVSVVESLFSMVDSPDVLFIPDEPRTLVEDIFKENRSLIVPSALGTSSLLRDMESDFGILPYPMYDESQGEYYTTTLNEVTMISVPITAPDPDKSALIIEAMCRESSDTVATAFYDIALQGKYARDEESLEMIGIIRDSLTFDVGWINSVITGVSGAQYYTMLRGNTPDFSSWYASQEASIAQKVAEFSEVYYN